MMAARVGFAARVVVDGCGERTAEMLGLQFYLPVRREPGRRPLPAGPELRGRTG